MTLFALCFALTIRADEVKTSTFRAGASKVEITPPLGELIVGGFVPFPADRVHDPLYAKCIAMDDGQNRIAIVICDNLGIRRVEFDEARKLISQETELPTENILMAATHTHSATRGQSEKYRPILIKGIAQAVRQAVANLEPAVVGWGSVDEPSEVFNRRWFVEDESLRHNPFGGVDQVRMNPPRGHASLREPAGPIDPEISFLSIQSTDGTQLALLANYSLHYVGGVGRGEISADYFALFAEAINQALGKSSSHPTMIGILSNGTSGDINNINFRQRDGRRWAPYEKMQQVAQLVAQRVTQAHQNITHQTWVPLASVNRELELDVRKPDEAMNHHLAEITALPDDAPKHHPYQKIYAQRVADLDAGPATISIPLQCLRIGNLAILGIPFETFAEIGLELKSKSPFPDTFTIELANDSRGYLPTPRHHELGGYETWMGTNRVEKQASVKITNTLLEMLQSLEQ
jgi:neutral ceramidase